MKVLVLTLIKRIYLLISGKTYSYQTCSIPRFLAPAFFALFVTSSFAQDNKADRLEVAPRTYTVRYATADGSISPIDPPAFVWLPVEKASQYTLQYSSQADFHTNQTVSVSCPRTIFVPRQLLGSGQWYWRFSIPNEQTGEQVYSRARAFTIAENATPVPFQDVKSVIAKLHGVRPRDFVRTEYLKRYRELGAGPLKNYIQELKDDCDKYIGQPLHPEPAFLPEGGQEKIVEFVKIMRSTRQFNGGLTACATTYLLTGE